MVKKEKYGLIIGLESGDLNIFVQDNEKWTKIYQLPQYYCLCNAVRRIKFNTRLSDGEKDIYTVATCGNDFSVRIMKLKLN